LSKSNDLTSFGTIYGENICLKHCTILETLSLRNNRLSGLIPETISNLEMLGKALKNSVSLIKKIFVTFSCITFCVFTENVYLDQNMFQGTFSSLSKSAESLSKKSHERLLVHFLFTSTFLMVMSISFNFFQEVLSIFDNSFSGELPDFILESKSLGKLINKKRNHFSH